MYENPTLTEMRQTQSPEASRAEALGMESLHGEHRIIDSSDPIYEPETIGIPHSTDMYKKISVVGELSVPTLTVHGNSRRVQHGQRHAALIKAQKYDGSIEYALHGLAIDETTGNATVLNRPRTV